MTPHSFCKSTQSGNLGTHKLTDEPNFKTGSSIYLVEHVHIRVNIILNINELKQYKMSQIGSTAYPEILPWPETGSGLASLILVRKVKPSPGQVRWIGYHNTIFLILCQVRARSVGMGPE